jgi:hypothetical protein
LLVVPKTSTTVWVLILLFGTPTATTTLLTTLAMLTSLLAALILTLILRHHYLPIGIFPRIQLRRSLTRSTCCPIVTQSYRVSYRRDVEARRSRWPCRHGRSAMKLLRPNVTSRSGRFFERAHYEKSIAATPRARMIMPPARMKRIDGSSIEPTRACVEHEGAMARVASRL